MFPLYNHISDLFVKFFSFLPLTVKQSQVNIKSDQEIRPRNQTKLRPKGWLKSIKKIKSHPKAWLLVLKLVWFWYIKSWSYHIVYATKCLQQLVTKKNWLKTWQGNFYIRHARIWIMTTFIATHLEKLIKKSLGKIPPQKW